MLALSFEPFCGWALLNLFQRKQRFLDLNSDPKAQRADHSSAQVNGLGQRVILYCGL